MSAKKKPQEPEKKPGPQETEGLPPPAGDQAAGAADEPPLAARTRECEQLLERLKRTTADFLNYQKRSERRMEEVRQFAVRDLLLDLLPVLDNFERALAHAGTQSDFQSLLDGIRLVHDQFVAAIQKHGVEKIEAQGRPFDPEHHEAVAHLPSDEHPEGHVADVMQAGYRLHDQTLRPSRVTVSKGRTGEVEPQPEDGAAGEEAAEENKRGPDERAEDGGATSADL